MRFLLVFLCACGRLDFDASHDAAAPDVILTSCTSGQRIAPIGAQNTSLSAAADACSIDSALARDGLTAGLDRGLAPCSAMWDPNGSCGCLAVDLGAAYDVSAVNVVEAPVVQACGTKCTSPDCGTGHAFSVLVSTDLTTWTKVAGITYDGTALAEQNVAVTQPVRYVITCRQAWSSTRDDVAIDYVDATCR